MPEKPLNTSHIQHSPDGVDVQNAGEVGFVGDMNDMISKMISTTVAQLDKICAQRNRRSPLLRRGLFGDGCCGSSSSTMLLDE